jgi:hypothetical protein
VKKKVYGTGRERRADQILGFLAFPLVNLPLGLVLWTVSQTRDSSLLTLAWALPWLINGIVLFGAFLLRPEFGVGYIAFVGIVLIIATALSFLFVAACFVSVFAGLVLGDMASVLFFILLLAGLYGLGVFAVDAFRNWWSSNNNNSE